MAKSRRQWQPRALVCEPPAVLRRLQSGFDKKLGKQHTFATYAAMALSLPIRELINRRLR